MAPRSRKLAASRPKQARASARSHMGQQILHGLRERILNWYYPPGAHLGEEALCAEYSASRVPVREALRVLAEQGLVDKLPNQGCYVKQPDVDGIHELYDLRLALELFVVERLAQNGLPPELEKSARGYWEPFLLISAEAQLDGNEFVRSDEEFHLGLARAVGNSHIIETLGDINERLRFVRLAVPTTPHRVQATAGGHLAVMDALARKDVEAARRSLAQNINEARNKVELALARALTNAHRRKR